MKQNAGNLSHAKSRDSSKSPHTTERGTLAEVRRKALDEAAKAVPTNWVDPLLTGPDGVFPEGGPITTRHIEALLRGVQDRIRTMIDATPEGQ